MNIQKVKEFENIYLVNDSISIPKDDSNKDYKEVLEWIAEGNTPDPEFTEAEILQNAKDAKIKELEIFHE